MDGRPSKRYLVLALFMALALVVTVAGVLTAPPSWAAQVQQQDGTSTPEGTPMGTPSPDETEAPEPQPTGHSVADVATPGGDLPGEPAIQLIMVADGFSDPINVVPAPDDSGRLFVVQRNGVISIIEDGQVLEEPFLDISEDVLDAFLEQGMYDLVFDPGFSQNGTFYVHFAELLRNGDGMIVQYQVSEDDPNRADPESSRVILQIEQPWANHNGGELAFGPDGYLYIGSGDGGWEGDPLEAGQDLSTLLGKLLRIDVSNQQPNMPYSIPADNPFAQEEILVELFGIPEQTFADIHTEAQPEIWAYGLRNPWKFQFDPETGDLYLPDVGQNHWEEINFQPAGSQGGENYGWDILMGTYCFPIESSECSPFGVLPVAQYSHDLGCTVIGFGVYRGDEIPDLDGVYLFGDYCSGRIWGLARDDNDEWQMEELLQAQLQFTGAGQDQDGNIYVTTCNCNYGGPGPTENQPGAVWQIVGADQEIPEGTPTAPVAGPGDMTTTPSATETLEGTTAPDATGTPDGGAAAGGDAAAGQALADQNGCLGCHSTTGQTLVGPTFQGLYGSMRPLQDGSEVQADEEYLRNSILNPEMHVVEGFPAGTMPSYAGRLDDRQIQDIIAYLETLQ